MRTGSQHLAGAWLGLLISGSIALPFFGEKLQHRLSPKPVMLRVTPSPSTCSDPLPGGATTCEFGAGNYRITIAKPGDAGQSSSKGWTIEVPSGRPVQGQLPSR
jgi:hypothetical protein